jgi:hypothetical protein
MPSHMICYALIVFGHGEQHTRKSQHINKLHALYPTSHFSFRGRGIIRVISPLATAGPGGAYAASSEQHGIFSSKKKSFMSRGLVIISPSLIVVQLE